MNFLILLRIRDMTSSSIPQEKFAEAREWFRIRGISCTDWASQHGVDRSVLYAVLSGKSQCIRGESHRVAVLLGLKPNLPDGVVPGQVSRGQAREFLARSAPMHFTGREFPAFKWSLAGTINNYRLSRP